MGEGVGQLFTQWVPIGDVKANSLGFLSVLDQNSIELNKCLPSDLSLIFFGHREGRGEPYYRW